MDEEFELISYGISTDPEMVDYEQFCENHKGDGE